MAKGSLRVVKVPVPNSKHFAIRVNGHLVECLEFQAEVFRDTGIALPKGQQNSKVGVFLWCLIIEEDTEETHEFVMVNTGEDFPMMEAEIQYVASSLVPLPDGNIAELHLFWAGENEALAEKFTQRLKEAANDGVPE